jgi:RNA polymerase sigma factor (sigma-70 family)
MNATQTDFLRHLRSLAARRATGVLSDQQLLETFLHQRSEASFTALVQRQGPMVFGVCRRLLGHVQDAEDAFQATFLVLARQAASIRKHESVGGFLHGVARRIAEKLKRTAARRTMRERQCARPLRDDPGEDITWRELRGVLDEELAKLPERYRAPLVLCYLEARTQDEAARRLGWSRNTFFRCLSRARELLARRLARRGLTLTAALTAPLLADSAATAMPPLLAANTVRAGLALANGQATAGLVSDRASSLMGGGMQTLSLTKTKIAVLLLGAGCLAAGLGVSHQSRIAQLSDSREQTKQKTAEKDNDRAAMSWSSKSRKVHGMPPESLEVHGVIRGPDGKPIKGAKVYGDYSQDGMKRQVVTGEDGRYHFTLRRENVDAAGYYADPWQWPTIAAIADGYGLDWRALGERGKGNRLDLHLVKDDAPINGRILDLEGRPVVGATIRIVRLHATAEGNLSTFLKQWTTDPQQAVTGSPMLFMQNNMEKWRRAGGRENVPIAWRRLWHVYQMGLFPSVKTDQAGRFRLTGLGRERFVELLVSGPGIEQTELRIVTRKEVDGKALSKPSADYLKHFDSDYKLLFPWPTLYGPSFDHVAAPTKPIMGVVRDKVNGKPVAGIRIVGRSPLAKRGCFWREDIETVTDAKGVYRLTGLPKDREYSLLVGAPKGVSYLPQERHLLDTTGFEPLKAEFELERGILVEGRLLDKISGKPIAGEVHYAPLPTNTRIPAHHREALSQFILQKHFVGKDGSFKFVVYPGPGIVYATAAAGKYLPIRFTPAEKKLGLGKPFFPGAGPAMIQGQSHRLIDADVKMAPLKCDLIFQPDLEADSKEKP